MTASEENPKLIYVGDPMCSWCYGISEELGQLVDHYGNNLDLEVVLGGLRAGGGDEWNENFTTFLRHHWEDVGMKSGQPFSFKLLDEPFFEYDTEPACRAVVTVENISEEKMLPFFKEVQKGFYVRNEDPKKVEFYRSICSEMDIDFDAFSKLFLSDDLKLKTKYHFVRSSQLNVRSFPTLLLEYKGKVHKVAVGFQTFKEMKSTINTIIG